MRRIPYMALPRRALQLALAWTAHTMTRAGDFCWWLVEAMSPREGA